ncbi:hypothetical protein J4458_03405 [Candidatus Woesearchaeota archaeon]|nr:hypothetical protein [Candidatus Woesearchaeota archaeon]
MLQNQKTATYALFKDNERLLGLFFAKNNQIIEIQRIRIMSANNKKIVIEVDSMELKLELINPEDKMEEFLEK